jgi:hypothetical protein
VIQEPSLDELYEKKDAKKVNVAEPKAKIVAEK